MLAESSVCCKSWNELWSCIIREFEREAGVVSSVVQMSWEVLESTTKCKTSTEREDRRALMIKWSCYFHDKYAKLTESAYVAADARCEGRYNDVPSTKEYTFWPKRNGFICILQYKKLVLESFKETTWCVIGIGMMAAVVDTP